MKLLVAVATRHGSTREIADAIARELRVTGLAVDVRTVAEISSIEPYDAAIIGSAVYIGNWLTEAREFVMRHKTRLAEIPVWLFSSGPLGHKEPHPQGDPEHLDELVHATQALGHRIFVGKLDTSTLGIGERIITRMVRAPEGDFRDWEAIHDWAGEIANALQPAAAPGIERVDR